MNAIKPLAETADTVTLRRADLDRLIETVEDAEDMASVNAWRAWVDLVGKDRAVGDGYTDDQVNRLLAGESPIRIWREKRKLSQRQLANAAALSAGYLNEIELNKKPGSVAAFHALAKALGVPMEYLVDD
jgi:DNA-binding XRE family transcriptional regulator